MSDPGSSLTKDLLKSFAEGLASDAGGEIGGLLFASIFPGGSPPIDLNELCQRLEDIVHDEIVANDINTLKGNINDVITYMGQDYPPFKQVPGQYSLDVLMGKIKDYAEKIGDAVSQFTSNPDWIQLGGFPIYLLAVNTRLAMLQEQAMVDSSAKDANGVIDPWLSGYVVDIGSNANAAIEFAPGQWDQLQATRKAAVTVEKGVREVPNPFDPGETVTRWRWTDSVTGDTGEWQEGEGDAGQLVAIVECGVRQAQVLDTLRSDNGDPNSIIAQWQKVAISALPGPPVVQINSFTVKRTSSAGTSKGDPFPDPSPKGKTITWAWVTTGAISARLEISGDLLMNSTDILTDALASGSLDFTPDLDFGGDDPGDNGQWWSELVCVDKHHKTVSASPTDAGTSVTAVSNVRLGRRSLPAESETG
jgi:hypothetical protein